MHLSDPAPPCPLPFAMLHPLTQPCPPRKKTSGFPHTEGPHPPKGRPSAYPANIPLPRAQIHKIYILYNYLEYNVFLQHQKRSSNYAMSMDRYPKNSGEFSARFQTDGDCRRYLISVRWPDGYECPVCHTRGKGWRMSDGRIRCAACRACRSSTAETVFQGSHMPLLTWFRVMWHLCLPKNGASALGFQRSQGLGAYRTAWLCLHRLRKAMVRPGREPLSGRIEVDKISLVTPCGSPLASNHGSAPSVLVFAENKDRTKEDGATTGRHLGRIRLVHLQNAAKDSLHKALLDNIDPESTLVASRRDIGESILSLNYPRVLPPSPPEKHQTPPTDSTKPAETPVPRDPSPPKCRLVSLLLRRWVMGTLQGSLGESHLQDYLNEFTFRFNRRSSRSRGMLFWRLVQIAVQHSPDTLDDIATSSA